MEKLATSGFKGSLLLVFYALASFTVALPAAVHAQGCVMTCPPNNPPLQIPLSSACSDILTYAQLGVMVTGCAGPIEVQIFDNGVPIGNIINSSMIGLTYMVIVSDPSGQSCMTFITVVDKQAPLVACPANTTLACNTDLSTYVGLTQAGISDCSDTQIFKDDVLLSSGNCVGNIVSQYERTYVVSDIYNNAATCTQIISLVKADLANVDFPPDLTGVNALSCYPAPNTAPSNTGYPTVDGQNIINGTFCNLTAVPVDITVAVCTGSYKIFRTWTVYDRCANNIFIDSTQIIEVLDKTGPIVNAPADLTVSTGPSNCNADVTLPPALISEEIGCSTSWTVRMEGPFGTVFTNGGTFSNLPIGVHRIIYKATNDCGLEGKDTMFITVQDLTPPTPVCNPSLNIPVDNTGIVLIPAYIFNSASFDNCGPVYFKVKRMTQPAGYSCSNPGNPNNLFDDFVQFCCSDIAHNPIRLIMRVYDSPPIAGPVSDSYLSGHFNDCMVQVEVQDKLPPSILCPSDLTISCQFPYAPGNLNVFGKVVLAEEDRDQICIDDPGDGIPGVHCIGLDGLAQDNCGVSVTSTANITVNNCGTGTIIRTFTATDDGGRQSTCQQTISIINYFPFNLSDIQWPLDLVTTNICEIDSLDSEHLSPPYNEPVLTEGPCGLVGMSYDDDVFEFAQGQPCFKILRTWTVIDWCQLNLPATGIWTHLQVIKVTNSEPPEFDPIEDIDTCSYDPNCNGLTLDFAASAHDDCSSQASLSWTYYIDIDNNSTFDFTSSVLTGGEITFSHTMPIGLHRILYSVWDHCGNINTIEQFVNVRSCKGPSAKCIVGLSTNLMAMGQNPSWGMVTMTAEMFDAGSDHPCGNPFSLAFSSEPSDDTRVFDCSNLGVNPIELWAIDINGLTDVCTTYVDIQDNNNICPNTLGGTGVISGNLKVPGSGNLGGAMVYLDGSNLAGSPSGSNGYFVFPAMPFGGQYSVRPAKIGDAKNGVTTLDLVQIQKHLLGIITFDSPFQYIAADANNSQSITAIDIITLRKLILGYFDELPNSPSWRFVDEAYVFPDIHNPWISSFPETYTINPFSSSMNDVNFNAIKIGDINSSANVNADNQLVLPRTDQSCDIQYLITQQPEQDVFRVDMYLTGAEKYNAIQFSFDWYQEGFQILDWKPGENLTPEDIRMPNQPGQVASMVSFTTGNWPDGKMLLLTMWVKQKSQDGLPFKLFLKPQPTIPLAYIADQADPIRIQLSGMSESNQQINNRPNPFKDQTTIIFRSTRQEKAVIQWFDVNGRLILKRDVSLDLGENEFIIHASELTGPGMYTYEIKSDFQHSTNRMIIVN